MKEAKAVAGTKTDSLKRSLLSFSAIFPIFFDDFRQPPARAFRPVYYYPRPPTAQTSQLFHSPPPLSPRSLPFSPLSPFFDGFHFFLLTGDVLENSRGRRRRRRIFGRCPSDITRGGGPSPLFGHHFYPASLGALPNWCCPEGDR